MYACMYYNYVCVCVLQPPWEVVKIKLSLDGLGRESWHAIKKLFNLPFLHDSQGQVSNNKVSNRV